MTLVSDSPHVASLLRVNISKLGCALQAYLTKSINWFTAFSLAGKTASIALGFIYALQANFIYAIALTSLCSSGSISLNSSATFSLDSLRAFIGLQLFP